MRHLEIYNIEGAKKSHFEAVKNRLISYSRDEIEKVYNNIIQLFDYPMSFDECYENNDYNWLRLFILAEPDALRDWVKDKSHLLQSDIFLRLYLNYFSNGANRFLDTSKTYNAYTFLENLDIRVCPYCDDEYIDELKMNDGLNRRSSEIDHYFAKSDYPALAMCFYNLIPSGKSCNQIRNNSKISSNPYDEDIESLTHITTNLKIGVNYEAVTEDDFCLLLNAREGMVDNDNAFGLEAKYNNRKAEALNYLRKRQKYPEEKIKEMIKDNYFDSIEEANRAFFGALSNDEKRNSLHQKMKFDLIGL